MLLSTQSLAPAGGESRESETLVNKCVIQNWKPSSCGVLELVCCRLTPAPRRPSPCLEKAEMMGPPARQMTPSLALTSPEPLSCYTPVEMTDLNSSQMLLPSRPELSNLQFALHTEIPCQFLQRFLHSVFCLLRVFQSSLFSHRSHSSISPHLGVK